MYSTTQASQGMHTTMVLYGTNLKHNRTKNEPAVSQLSRISCVVVLSTSVGLNINTKRSSETKRATTMLHITSCVYHAMERVTNKQNMATVMRQMVTDRLGTT